VTWSTLASTLPPSNSAARRLALKHVRFPVRDFDPFDLRLKLPRSSCSSCRCS